MKPTRVTSAQAQTMVQLRDQKASYGRKGHHKSCGHCTLGFNKAEQRWTLGAYWMLLDENGDYILDENMRRESARARHSIAFDGFDPEAMERLNAHWKGFCEVNNIDGRA